MRRQDDDEDRPPPAILNRRMTEAEINERGDLILELTEEEAKHESYEARRARKEREYEELHRSAAQAVATLSAVATPDDDYDEDRKESYKQQVAKKHALDESFSDEEDDHVAAILALTGNSVSSDDVSGKFAAGSPDSFHVPARNRARHMAAFIPPPVATRSRTESNMTRLHSTWRVRKVDPLRDTSQSETIGISVPGAYQVSAMEATVVANQTDNSLTHDEPVDEIYLNDEEENTGVEPPLRRQVPARTKSKLPRRRFWFILAGILVLLIAVGAGVGVSLSTNTSAAQPTPSPTSTLQAGTQSQGPAVAACGVNEIYSECQMGGPNFSSDIPDCALSHYEVARASISNIDPSVTAIANSSCVPENLGLLALAVNEEDDKVVYVLNVLYFASNGSEWYDRTNWLSKEPVCSWHGIVCNSDNVVVSIDLTKNNLSGSLPSAIGLLDTLVGLSLESNSLTSTIPTDLGTLPKLTSLSLKDNPFDFGPIPSEIFGLRRLMKMDLSATHLMGTLPMNISDLTSLTSIVLEKNQFSGTIPSEIFSITSLIEFNVASNSLNGTIPSEMGSLPIIESILIHHNDLTGRMPTELGRLSSLFALTFSDNNLSGFIPQRVCNLSLTVFGGISCPSIVRSSFYGGLQCPNTQCCIACPISA